MSKYNRPDFLRVIGKTYSVDYVPNEDIEGALGMCTYAEQKIEIDDAQLPAEELDTFLHETMHAIVRGMRIDFPTYEAEEAVVDRMGAGLAAVLLDNPDVVKYIQRLVKAAENG